MLGSTLCSRFIHNNIQFVGQSFTTTGYLNVNLTDRDSTFDSLNKINPNIIINLVGLTSVERCEEYSDEAYLINAKTVENIVNWIARNKSSCHLIHISTDQVYSGEGPHLEDNACPINTYALSKYSGELAALLVPSTILRTNFVGKSSLPSRQSLSDWVFDSLNSGLEIQVLTDVLFTPLSMTTLSDLIIKITQIKPIGIYNVGSHGGMSKADFDMYFANLLNLPIDLMRRIESKDADFLKAQRPKDMRMNLNKIENELNIKLPTLVDEIITLSKDYLS